MKPKNSKPKRSKANPRACRIAISVTPDEKKTLQERASNVDLKVSEYVYMIALEKTVKVDNPQFAADVSKMLNISNNLNQIARVANLCQALPKETRTELDECLALIRKTLSNL